DRDRGHAGRARGTGRRGPADAPCGRPHRTAHAGRARAARQDSAVPHGAAGRGRRTRADRGSADGDTAVARDVPARGAAAFRRGGAGTHGGRDRGGYTARWRASGSAPRRAPSTHGQDHAAPPPDRSAGRAVSSRRGANRGVRGRPQGVTRVKRTLVLLPLLFTLSGCGYNRIQQLDELTEQNRANIETELMRRNDLIPNLVRTVEEAAEFEQETFTQVAQARSGLDNAR